MNTRDTNLFILSLKSCLWGFRFFVFCETTKCLRHGKVSKVIVTDPEATIQDAALKWKGVQTMGGEVVGLLLMDRSRNSFFPTHPLCAWYMCDHSLLIEWMTEWTNDFDTIVAGIVMHWISKCYFLLKVSEPHISGFPLLVEWFDHLIKPKKKKNTNENFRINLTKLCC